MRTATFTICSANYLAYARTLLTSCAEAGISDLFLFLCDTVPGEEDALAGLPAETMTADALGIDGFADMAFRYSVMEMNTAIKPSCIAHLFARGYEAAVYLDPDILVLRPLEAVTEALEAGADMVLTPHLCAPLEDGKHPGEVEILQSGTYNLGFGAFANTDDTRAFVAWWARRLRYSCVVDVPGGLFVDQRFVDLAPGYVDRVHVLRDPGYNVAYWNQAHRRVERAAGGWTANGRPLAFYHFSGVTPPSTAVYSKHQDRLKPADLGAGRALFEDYVGHLVANGHEDRKRTPYAYAAFTDGVPIPDVVRRCLRADAKERPLPFADPFAERERVAARLKRPAPGVRQLGSAVVSELLAFIWAERPDLQAAFPITTTEGQAQLAGWFAATAEREYGLPRDMVPNRPAEAEGPGARAGASGDGAPPPRAGPRARAVAARRAGASAVLANANRLRPFYSVLPKGVRVSARNALLRSQIGPSPRPMDAAERPYGARGAAVHGYFTAETGVGEGARRAVAALEAVGYPVTTRTVPSGASDSDRLDWTPRQDAPDGAFVISHVNADQTPHMHRWLDATYWAGRYAIGYWAWELERFPEAWTDAFAPLHEVWVPSAFTRDAVASATRLPVRVIPHPLRPGSPPPDEAARTRLRTELGAAPDDFVLLSAFDVNSWPERKNPDGAVAAFRAARARTARPLRLVVKMHGRVADPERYDAVRGRLSGLPGVHLVEEVLDEGALIALQHACDAFVSLHRSEGFGLMVAEMMQLGKPVVVTGYSGTMAFCDEENACLVRYERVPVPEGAYPFWQGQHWAEPDTEHAADLICRLAGDGGFAAAKAEAGRAAVTAALSPERVGATMTARLDEVLAEIGAARRG